MTTTASARPNSVLNRPRLILAAAGTLALAAAAAGLARQPGAAGSPPVPPASKWEYAALSRSITVDIRAQSTTATDWRLCAPGEDLGSESTILGKYGGSSFGAQTEVSIINGLADKGWELVTHQSTSTFEPKEHNGTTSEARRIVTDQWWLKRIRPVK